MKPNETALWIAWTLYLAVAAFCLGRIVGMIIRKIMGA